jgi:twitching motility protein PilJ
VWINSLDKGGNPEIAQKLTELKNAYTTFQEASEGIRGSVEDIKRANQSFLIIANGVDALLRGADTVARAYRFDSAPFFMKLSGLMAIAILLLIALIRIPIVNVTKHIQESRRQAEILEKERQASVENNKITQAAIMRLMDELGDLADGDLTISATVTEDITGVIADSINYAVEELRGLVKKINEASSQVTDATRTAQHTSSRLLEAARHQSLIIEETGNSVLAMASSMTTISHEADLSAKVAHSSLAASQKGTHAVNNSIRSMNQIRGQIQETAKRIKRLGESSQEIGEIVELISNITEQTNVLALNSAIQAASAGEAGRGFTVIAEEIQLLAERSAEATKQINALVKTIQTDTQEAILAMEESTQGVVDGAKLSDAAGQALTEIGTVSQQLAELIEKISATTKNQADSAANVAKRMQDILQVTQQATVGTQKTASAIGELNVLAAELKGSVAGFKVS